MFPKNVTPATKHSHHEVALDKMRCAQSYRLVAQFTVSLWGHEQEVYIITYNSHVGYFCLRCCFTVSGISISHATYKPESWPIHLNNSYQTKCTTNTWRKMFRSLGLEHRCKQVIMELGCARTQAVTARGCMYTVYTHCVSYVHMYIHAHKCREKCWGGCCLHVRTRKLKRTWTYTILSTLSYSTST
jgi:hypothetical protein